MLTLMLRLARRFQVRTLVAFGCGVAFGLVVFVSVLVGHARGACSPIEGVPGVVICKVP